MIHYSRISDGNPCKQQGLRRVILVRTHNFTRVPKMILVHHERAKVGQSPGVPRYKAGQAVDKIKWTHYIGSTSSTIQFVRKMGYSAGSQPDHLIFRPYILWYLFFRCLCFASTFSSPFYSSCCWSASLSRSILGDPRFRRFVVG